MLKMVDKNILIDQFSVMYICLVILSFIPAAVRIPFINNWLHNMSIFYLGTFCPLRRRPLEYLHSYLLTNIHPNLLIQLT